MQSLAAKNMEPYLEQDETLLWAGQPKKGIVFEPADILNIIFVIALIIFTYFACHALAKISLLLAIVIAVIFGSICILLGFVRFFIDASLRSKTFYGLTNKRIIIKAPGNYTTVQSVYFSSKPRIEFLPNIDDTSTIDIGLKSPSTGKTGISWIPNEKATISLYKLTDANLVHQKIKELMSDL
ncbi:hypothetical protein [Ferruginibacter sp.]